MTKDKTQGTLLRVREKLDWIARVSTCDASHQEAESALIDLDALIEEIWEALDIGRGHRHYQHGDNLASFLESEALLIQKSEAMITALDRAVKGDEECSSYIVIPLEELEAMRSVRTFTKSGCEIAKEFNDGRDSLIDEILNIKKGGE